MIEVDLHPDRDRDGRGRGRLAFPRLGRAPRWHGFRADPWHRTFLVCAALVPLVVGTAWLTQRSELAGLRAELAAARTDSSRVAARVALGDSLAERRRTVARHIERVRALDRDRYTWPHLMHEIARSLPAGAWLSALETERPAPDVGLRIEGMARTPLEITEFVRALQALAFVDGVRIRSSRRVVLEREYAQSFVLFVSCQRQLTGGRSTPPHLPGEG